MWHLVIHRIGADIRDMQMGEFAVFDFKLKNVFTATIAVVGLMAALLAPGHAFAQSSSGQRTIVGETMIPGISVTPDGCEVWVMDDGAEGYAVNNVRRDGTPVCREINVCGVMNTDQFFATNRFTIGAAGQGKLREFFNASTAFAFIVVGHTDSRASDEYNMRLSQNRANAVAKVGHSTGARIIEVRGYGERQPKSTNSTAAGRADNRRVEILCVK